jgi:hypothetical protein
LTVAESGQRVLRMKFAGAGLGTGAEGKSWLRPIRRPPKTLCTKIAS